MKKPGPVMAAPSRFRPICLAWCLGVLGVPNAFSADPAWWSAPGTAILDPNASHAVADNYAPASVGQLKNAATQAKKHLEQYLPLGAGSGVQAVVAEFQSNADNYAPLNLGQLKRVVKPFYDRLRAATVNYDTRASLVAHGYAAGWSSVYPWPTSPVTPVANNYAPANIGQIKAAFSFDLTGYSLPDSNGNGLPDEWEQANNVTDPNGDSDGDGLRNADERTNLTSLTAKDHPAVKLQVSVIVN